jgi:hypothetical protein
VFDMNVVKKRGDLAMNKLPFIFILIVLIIVSLAGSAGFSVLAAPAQKERAVLRWVADPAKDGLNAFEGVEDDRDHSEPGVKHIFVEGDTYRFNMSTDQREGSGDRQRNEVKGMREGGEILSIDLGTTWRFTYSMFIPSTLKGTTSFTHIMQLKRPGPGSAPLVTMSLRRSGDTEVITLRAFDSGVEVAHTELAHLRDHWIDTEVEVTAGPAPQGRLHWKLIDRGQTLVDAERTGVNTWLGDRLRPKWGIYRSVKDKANLMDTHLLLRNMRAYQIQ